MSEEDRLDVAYPEIDKLNILEENVKVTLMSGQINGKELSAAQSVELLKEWRRIIEDRCRLLGVMPPEVVVDR